MKAIILAAGLGTRMNSNIPKPLMTLCKKPMIQYLIDLLKRFQCDTYVVVRDGHSDLIKYLNNIGIKYILQTHYTGTFGAVYSAKEVIDDDILILNADMPLITYDCINQLMNKFNEKKCSVVAISKHEDSKYDKVKISKSIVKKIGTCVDSDYINLGIYMFSYKDFCKMSSYINDYKIEYDIPQMVENISLEYSMFQYSSHFENVNDRITLQKLENYVLKEFMIKMINNGVIIKDIDTTHIDLSVKIESGAIIYPNVVLKNNTVLTKESIIHENCVIDSSFINGSIIINSHIANSYIDEDNIVGPYSRIRDNCFIGKNNTIGNFVELKNVKMGMGNQIKHHSYLGDLEMGDFNNIGDFVVSANYDGVKKHFSVIKNKVFIGCHTTLISPFIIEDGCYIGANSIIRKHLADNTFIMPKQELIVKDNYASSYLEKLSDKI